jgi:hypothetical protein
LNPSYTLSKVEVRQATPPKFIRDAMNIDDLEDARPKANRLNQLKTKDVMKVDDIQGTKARPRHQARGISGGYSAFDYSDVTKQERISKRVVNPLDPVYTIQDENGKTYTVGMVEGSKPAKAPDAPKAERLARAGSLQTSDIEGATTSTKGLGVFAHVTRR